MPDIRTIAVVNDDLIVREALARELRALGHSVVTYANTADALDLIDQPVDLAVIDGHNPPLGGVELFRRLRRTHSMPVVFVSAWPEDIAATLQSEGLAADAYISLPALLAKVAAQINALLDAP